MQVTFKSFGPIRKILQRQVLSLDVPENANVRHVIDTVVDIAGFDLKRLVLDDDGKISGNLIVLLNKRDIATFEDGLHTIVCEGDEVALLPHVQGG